MKDKIQQLGIRHLYKKACKAMARFDNAIGRDKKNLFMKELLNRVYGKSYINALFSSNEVNFGSVLEKIKYDYTDSIADGMKYTE